MANCYFFIVAKNFQSRFLKLIFHGNTFHSIYDVQSEIKLFKEQYSTDIPHILLTEINGFIMNYKRQLSHINKRQNNYSQKIHFILYISQFSYHEYQTLKKTRLITQRKKRKFTFFICFILDILSLFLGIFVSTFTKKGKMSAKETFVISQEMVHIYL